MGHHSSVLSILVVMLTLNLNFNLTSSSFIPIHKLIYNNNGRDAYSFEYKTGNGIFRQEEGGINPENGDLVVRGHYSYIDPKGYLRSVSYIADTNGFQPVPGEDTRFNDRRLF